MKDVEKIHFSLEIDHWSGVSSERLWGKRVHGDVELYQIQNSPFFIYDISYLDVVKATRSPDGELVFEAVIERGGHSTYVLVVDPEGADFLEYWRRIEKLNCSYEHVRHHLRGRDADLYSVDVPGTTDLKEVYKIFVQGEDDGIWVFEQNHLGHQGS